MTADARRATGAGMLKLYRAYWAFAAGRRLRIAGASALLVASQVIKSRARGSPRRRSTPSRARRGRARPRGRLHRPPAWRGGAVVGAARARAHPRALDRGARAREPRRPAVPPLASLPLAWHERHHSGDTVQRVRKAGNALYDFAQSQFLYLQNFVNLAGPVIALGLLSGVLGVAALAGYLVIALVVVRFDRALMRLVAEQNRAERRYAAALTDALGNVATIASLRLQASHAAPGRRPPRRGVPGAPARDRHQRVEVVRRRHPQHHAHLDASRGIRRGRASAAERC